MSGPDQPYTEAEVARLRDVVEAEAKRSLRYDHPRTACLPRGAATGYVMADAHLLHQALTSASVRQGGELEQENERLREVIRAHDADRELGQCYGLLSDTTTAAPTEGESE